MSINPSSVTYIAWRDPQGLHEDSVQCISELRFAKDELQFLSDLIKGYTLPLLSEKYFNQAKAVSEEISSRRKEIKPLIKELIAHSNLLETLVDDIDIPDEEDEFKTEHYRLMFEAVGYLNSHKKLKRRIFTLIKQVMKEKKKNVNLLKQ